MTIPTSSARRLPPIVLVVEDDPDTRELYETVLNLEGFWVADACDAEAALDQAVDLQPDVVITDIGLPGGCDGVGFADRLHAQARTAQIPVVAITGRPVRDFEGAGFLQVLQKPILPEALIASVRSALASSHELRERGQRARGRVPELKERSDRLLKKARRLAERRIGRERS
ncbi:MAG: response regulator [Acidobacteriota bacterium]|nr:response regulator [Acidobacteriota bacterium]